MEMKKSRVRREKENGKGGREEMESQELLPIIYLEIIQTAATECAFMLHPPLS